MVKVCCDFIFGTSGIARDISRKLKKKKKKKHVKTTVKTVVKAEIYTLYGVSPFIVKTN